MTIIDSNIIEPSFAHVIGVQFARCEAAKAKDQEKHPYALYDACKNFWYSMDAMRKLMVSVRGGSDAEGGQHASVALGTDQRRVADYIEQCIGYHPISGDQNGKKDPSWGWK